MNRRPLDRWALGLFSVSLMLAVILQVVPFSYSASFSGGSDRAMEAFMGYQIWKEVVGELMNFTSFDVQGLIISVALLLGATMVIASPFVVQVIASNRAIWWLTAISSGLVFIGLTVVFSWMLGMDPPDPEYWRIGPGLICLMVFPVTHFAGVLCVRHMEAGTALAPGPVDR